MRDRTKIASLIIAWLELPHGIAQTLSEDEIIALVEFDHYPCRKADGGPDAHWNLRPLLRHDHLAKTKLDAKDMAHERKVRRAVAEHADRMAAKGQGPSIGKPMKYRWPKRRLRS